MLPFGRQLLDQNAYDSCYEEAHAPCMERVKGHVKEQLGTRHMSKDSLAFLPGSGASWVNATRGTEELPPSPV